MSETDEELMRTVALRQDGAAFRELMTRYHRILVNHFCRRGVYEAYEDLAQETFFKIYRARKKFNPEQPFKAWMFTIAQRVWIDYLRKTGRRKNREEAFRQEPRPASHSPDPMPGHDLDWALDHLSPIHREVVVLSVVDQLSHREIAEILGVPEGTVKSRRHHALKELRALFEPGEPL